MARTAAGNPKVKASKWPRSMTNWPMLQRLKRRTAHRMRWLPKATPTKTPNAHRASVAAVTAMDATAAIVHHAKATPPKAPPPKRPSKPLHM